MGFCGVRGYVRACVRVRYTTDGDFVPNAGGKPAGIHNRPARGNISANNTTSRKHVYAYAPDLVLESAYENPNDERFKRYGSCLQIDDQSGDARKRTEKNRRHLLRTYVTVYTLRLGFQQSIRVKTCIRLLVPYYKSILN